MKQQGITREDLILDLAQGCKPREKFRIGVEHEKFIFDSRTLNRVPYEEGIEKILQGLEDLGWVGLFENAHLIALQKGEAFVSLEPGGQLELSGAPLSSLHETSAELQRYLKELQKVMSPLGFIAVGIGTDPLSKREDIPWMPKERYGIMRDYMPLKGQHGLDMMTATCTVQVNLDFSSEQDMVRKFRVGLALQPLATALFAHSSLTRGRPNGFQSFRRFIWKHTDPDRCGFLRFVFEESMGFERYVDYMLEVPLYFVRRAGHFINVAGHSFKDFLEGKLQGLEGEFPTLEDWNDHLTVAFPEVRLKKYLEMRGADGGLADHIQALPAFWTGLLYDEQALEATYALIKEWSFQEIKTLYDQVDVQGLATKVKGQTLKEVAQVCLKWTREGLQRRALKDAQGQDESWYLGYLDEVIASGKTAADHALDLFHRLQGDPQKLLEAFRFK